MGGFETGLSGSVEPTVRYHPDGSVVLTYSRKPGEGQWKAGSLTGAVSSKRVTEEHEGTLSTVGNRALRAKA